MPRYLEAAAFLLCGACTFSRTQTVVVIRADDRVIEEADEVRVEVRNHLDAAIFARTFPTRTSEFAGYPIELPISARNGDATRRFEVRVIAIRQRRQGMDVTTSTVAENRVRTSFRRGEVLRFPLWLLAGCRCNPDLERCEPDSNGDAVPECISIETPVDTSDAGVAEVDAGTEHDAWVSCGATQRLCSGQCVSRTTPMACGAACTQCPGVPGGMPVCSNDACTIVCDRDTPDRCPTLCTTFLLDQSNCGRCGNRCAATDICLLGECVSAAECTMAQDPACGGMTYCNRATNSCANGCDGRAGQCPSGQSCNVSTHTCQCATGSMRCGNGCAACPSGAEIVSTGCSGNACVIASCRAGFRPSSDGSACMINTSPLGQFTEQPSRSLSSRPVGTRGFARSLALSPDRLTLAVGDVNYGVDNQNGGVHIFVRSSVNGAFGTTPNQTIVGPAPGDDFGAGVAFSSDGLTLAVGDWDYGSNENGGVHFFARSNTTTSSFALLYSLAAPTGSVHFGTSVALSDDGLVLAVGDPAYGTGALGGVLLYFRASREQPLPLTPNQVLRGPQGSDDFGTSVALTADGLSLVVGDPVFADFAGAVHVYARASGASNFPATALQSMLGQNEDLFGTSVALASDGLTVAVGEPFCRDLGCVHLYRRATTEVTFAERQQSLNGSFGDEFGRSVAISRDSVELFVGVRNSVDGSGPGAGVVSAYSR